MCPPHCGDHAIGDDRALLHWPAPDAELAEAMLRGFALATAAAAALGLFFCLVGLSAQITSMRRREPVILDLSILRGAFCLALAAALAPALTACLSALAVSGAFEPLRFCMAGPEPYDFTRVAGVVGAVGPVVLFLVQTRRAKYRVVHDPDGRGLGGYRGPPRYVVRFADADRACRLVLHSFAMRVGLASTVALMLGWPWDYWGVPYTPGLFELTGSALVVLAFHFPTRAALDRQLNRALRRASAFTSARSSSSSTSPQAAPAPGARAAY